MKPSFAVFALIVGGLSGCNPTGIRSPEDITNEKLIGEWHLNAESKSIVLRDGGTEDDANWISINLSADQKVNLRLYRFDFEPKRKIEGSGFWRIDGRRLMFKMTAEGFYANESIDVGLRDEELVLWNFHGDPDEFETLIYEKRIEQVGAQ